LNCNAFEPQHGLFCRAMIGVFDSGIGGLSILRALRAELPQEQFVYLADIAHAPYGERTDSYVADRSLAITDYLRRQYGIKALVVACNTATAAAIHLLRAAHPGLPIVGVEPALKPAVAATRTARVGVLATRGTLASDKFQRLLAAVASQAHFTLTTCDGLADAIEQGVLKDNATEIEALCARYITATGQFGTESCAIDTLVLGCTHYPFASSVLQQLAGPGITLLETGAPVARQTRLLLQEAGLLAAVATNGSGDQSLLILAATERAERLQVACRRWLECEATAALVRL
jgi:glutamate racemase